MTRQYDKTIRQDNTTRQYDKTIRQDNTTRQYQYILIPFFKGSQNTQYQTIAFEDLST